MIAGLAAGAGWLTKSPALFLIPIVASLSLIVPHPDRSVAISDLHFSRASWIKGGPSFPQEELAGCLACVALVLHRGCFVCRCLAGDVEGSR